jgi:restriction system protein
MGEIERMTDEIDRDVMKPAYERFSPPQHHLPDSTEDIGADFVSAVPRQPASAVMTAHYLETRQLRSDILARIYVNSHQFFETLIIDVLLRMGYAGRRRDLARHLGRSGDGGIDGIIALDELGLDVILVQAKRLRPGTTVPVSHVRDFAGSLEARRASKGIFVTTAQFSHAAHEFVGAVSRRVVLVNGVQLADIMIRHNIGVRVRETYQFKELESTYFRPVAGAPV